MQNHHGSDTLTGLALGGGIEFAVRENVFIGADYLYENFGGSGGLPFATPPHRRLARLMIWTCTR